MNNVIIHILMATLALGSTGVAYAQTGVNASVQVQANVSASTSSQTKPIEKLREIKEEAKDQIRAVRSTIASTTAEIRENLAQRLEKKYEKMTARIQATIDREGSILGRINTRIQKIKAAGGKTEASEKLAIEAKMHLDEAVKSFSALKAAINSASTTSSTATSTGTVTKESIAKMRKASDEVKKHLKLAHETMVKAIVSLKGSSSINASSTVEVKVQN